MTIGGSGISGVYTYRQHGTKSQSRAWNTTGDHLISEDVPFSKMGDKCSYACSTASSTIITAHFANQLVRVQVQCPKMVVVLETDL